MTLALRPMLAGLALAAAPVAAHDAHAAIVVTAAWARPTPPGAAAGVAYLIIANTGARPDRLTAVSSPAAREVQLHLMRIDHGIMRMGPVTGGLAIPPHGRVSLAPGGYHLMLIAPTQPLVLGRPVPATLRFERAGVVKVAFAVRATPPAGGR